MPIIVGQLLLNIYISDMFFDIDICNVARTLCTSSFNLKEVIKKLESSTNNLFRWFKDNQMKANADKRRLLVTIDTNLTAKIGEFKNSKEEKLLDVKIETMISFPHFAKKKAKSYMVSQE